MFLGKCTAVGFVPFLCGLTTQRQNASFERVRTELEPSGVPFKRLIQCPRGMGPVKAAIALRKAFDTVIEAAMEAKENVAAQRLADRTSSKSPDGAGEEDIAEQFAVAEDNSKVASLKRQLEAMLARQTEMDNIAALAASTEDSKKARRGISWKTFRRGGDAKRCSELEAKVEELQGACLLIIFSDEFIDLVLRNCFDVGNTHNIDTQVLSPCVSHNDPPLSTTAIPSRCHALDNAPTTQTNPPACIKLCLTPDLRLGPTLVQAAPRHPKSAPAPTKTRSRL